MTIRWRELALLIASLLLGYLLAEAGYRAIQYATLPERIAALMETKRSAGAPEVHVFDAHTGYRYGPHLPHGLASPNPWHTNSHGHIAEVDYPRAKPAGEYRVAVLGDSFTAGINNTIRWTSVLEADLNGSPEWNAAIGGKATRVINFGVDGFGLVQMAAMLRYHALDFAPDRVLVNFIVDNVWRRVTYRQAPHERAELPAYVRRQFLGRVDWLSVCPALLAETVGYLWGMNCGLPLRADVFLGASPQLRYADRRAALVAAAAAARSILDTAPAAVFLQAPLQAELESRPPAEWVGLIDELRQLAPNLDITSMRNAFGTVPPASLFDTRDGHYTDQGNILYGHAIARELIRPFGQKNKSVGNVGSYPIPAGTEGGAN